MKERNCVGKGQAELSGMNGSSKKNGIALNFDPQSYQFHDLDLAMAVKRLSQQDQNILVLHLMGHTQEDIAGTSSISRSMVSKRIAAVTKILKRRLNQTV